MASRFRRVHGPTWIAGAVIYGAWVGLTLAHDRLPLPVLAVLGGAVIAWHGSLQHETIHGHPAGPPWLGRALGAPPLSLWLPYEIYRDTHLRHHATSKLTHPAHDPEAPFDWTAGQGGRLVRAVQATQRAALGRLVLGPPLTIAHFLWHELGALFRPDRASHRKAWMVHALLVGLLLLWLGAVAHLPLWKYALAFVYPGTSLTLLRSFAEHRHDDVPERRTTVVEGGLFFRLVFMNNNFHVAHHAAPRAPWFELPRLWAAQRPAVAPDLVHPGYLSLLRKRLLRAEHR